MANWCNNKFVAKGVSTEQWQRLKTALEKGFLESFMPIPAGLNEENKEDWRRMYWGTKLEVQDGRVLSEEPTADFEAEFDSAWSPPSEEFFEKVSEQFPGCVLINTYGEFESTEYIGVTVALDGMSLDWYDKGEDYFVYQVDEDGDEDIADETWDNIANAQKDRAECLVADITSPNFELRDPARNQAKKQLRKTENERQWRIVTEMVGEQYEQISKDKDLVPLAEKREEEKSKKQGKSLAESILNKAMQAAKDKKAKSDEDGYYTVKVAVELELEFGDSAIGVESEGGVEPWLSSEYGLETIETQLANGMADENWVEAVIGDIKKKITEGKVRIVSSKKEGN